MKLYRLVPLLLLVLTALSCEKKPLPPEEAVIEMTQLYEDYDINCGVVYDEEANRVYWARKGKYILSMSMDNPEEVTQLVDIEEARGYWAAPYGQIFIQDMALGQDGRLYVTAEKMVYAVSTDSGEYEVIKNDGFMGDWGAYGIELDSHGNVFVGDHMGGIHILNRANDWEHSMLLSQRDIEGLDSFCDILFSDDEKTMYCLDAESSKLFIIKLKWQNGIPEVKSLEKIEIPINYPEFMKLWQGDLFIQAARENHMIRLRDGEVIQQITVENEGEGTIGSIVTFDLFPVDDSTANFFATTWTPKQGLFWGKIQF